MQESRRMLVEAYNALKRAYDLSEYEGDRESDLVQIYACQTLVSETYDALTSPKPHPTEAQRTLGTHRLNRRERDDWFEADTEF